MKSVRSAKIIVLDADGNGLLLRRSGTHPFGAFEPDLPGGVTNDNETIEACVVRELQEETGLVVSEAEITHVYSMTVDTIPGISINRCTYAVRLADVSPPITLSYEHDQYSWVPVSELVGLESPYQKGINYAHEHNLWGSI